MRRVVAITLLTCLPLVGAWADIYRSVDAQGHVQYSDTPTPGAELVQRGSLTGSSLNAAGTPSSAAQSSLAKSDQQIRDDLNREQQQRSVEQDRAQARADQCKQAQDAYQKAIQARRIYTTDANGERHYMSDAEADQQRLTLRQDMDDACKSAQ